MTLPNDFYDNLKSTFKGDMILYPEATFGNMHLYVRKTKGVSEKVAKFYLNQIVETLLYV